jgi:hypothetical protein
MKVRADTEVAVLSERTDLDLAISTWLPGYVAQRTDDLDAVLDVTHRGGVVLIDLGSPRHEEWVAALRDRGFDGPAVFLDPRGDVTIDLRDRVVVPSPPSLSGLLAGFQEAQLPGTATRRRRGSEPGLPTSAGVPPPTGSPTSAGTRRRRSRASAVASARASEREQPGAGEEREATEPEAGVAGRARRLDRHLQRHLQTEEPGTPRARRSDRQRVMPTSAPWAARRRRSAAARSDSGLPSSTSGSQSELLSSVGSADDIAPGGSVSIGAEAERAFQAAFRAAETQPVVQRRIATPEGRIRVQTDEELFAGQPAATPVAGELGTVVTPIPPRERRVRTGA